MVYLLKEPLILENFFLDILLRGYHMKMQKKQNKNMKHQIKGVSYWTLYLVTELKKWKFFIFSMWNLVIKLRVLSRYCSMRMSRYFRVHIWGCQNVSEKILLRLPKFHENVLNHWTEHLGKAALAFSKLFAPSLIV